MNSISISFSKTEINNDLIKALSFASSDIINLNITEDKINLEIKPNGDRLKIEADIKKIVSKYNKERIEDEIIFSKDTQKKYFYSIDNFKNDGLITIFNPGIIGFNKSAINLFNYFSNEFKDIALKIGATEKKYPVLLPLDSINKTGYLKNSPQYSLFCSNAREDIDVLQGLYKDAYTNNLRQSCCEPEYSLSPSACFHTYAEYENQKLDEKSILTFEQKVFRNEGKFNWNDFGRLKDYTVRETVFFGDQGFINKCREKMLHKSKDICLLLNLDFRICITFDPFIIPAMQKYKKIQLMEKTKYEIQIAYEKNNYIAVASFNLHGSAFTKPFNISINDCPDPVTGCVGFGIDRWVLAFLAQYGPSPLEWPKKIKKIILGEQSE